jgi:hypothetical protein
MNLKRTEVTGQWRLLHEEFYDCSSPNITRVVKLRGLGSEGGKEMHTFYAKHGCMKPP